MKQAKLRRTDEEWTRVTEEMRKSSLTPKEWCAKQGINFYSLKDWEYRQKKKTQETTSKPKAQEWISIEPLDLPNQGEQVSVTSSKTEIFEVQIGPSVVRVPSGFDRVSFAEICKVLLTLC